MNLYTPGDGWFGTHVTWKDIEEDMRRELNTEAIFGKNKNVENIGEGKGFMSRIVLVDPDWQHKDRNLPERFVVKILTLLAMRKLNDDMVEKNGTDSNFFTEELMRDFEERAKALHNAEVTLYNHVMTLQAGKFPAPKIYYTRKFSESNPVKGYIIMEHMEDAKIVNIYENVPPKAMNKILHALAFLEACFLNVNTKKTDHFTQNMFSELYGPLLDEKAIESSIQSLRKFGGEYLAEKIDSLNDVVRKFLDATTADGLSEELGMQRVVCHGDLWSGNILWRRSDDDGLDLAALLDFQTVSMGCAASDLVRVFCACLSGRDRQEHWEELLEQFYGYLKEEISDQLLPYSLEQLKESYLRFFPFGAFLIASLIGGLFDILCKNPDEEQKKKSMQTAREKLECLLDDIVFFYHRNQKSLDQEHPKNIHNHSARGTLDLCFNGHFVQRVQKAASF
ncbi:unnamed protein product [Cylicocyclus nassatus]|uniref:CHK kinase-like domain-containing protein n=1 Tax=Cylicocyclus nassatus TaxID=53992 RepID=A0AA36DIW1_CYLNA|nr:unnamed protein product [Cylicocyclus nassatus]